ncbi:MAG: class I SAM-dependent methyltransferase [Polyangiaceae bacterium]
MSDAPSATMPHGLGRTALYTAEVWRWGGLANADLLANEDTRRVFDAVSFSLQVARPFQSDPRSLPHALLHRHTFIDRLLRDSGARQVIELAAGLSRRGLTFSADPAMRYTEVDLGGMVAYKTALLRSTARGREALSRERFQLVAGDALEVDLQAHRDPAQPLFVIAEGLLMYLSADKQEVLMRRVRDALAPAGGWFVFDLVPGAEEPAPGAAGRALGWLMRRFTSGQTFVRDVRDRAAVSAAFAGTGYAVEAREPAREAHALGLPFPDEPTRMVVFEGRAAAG